LPRAMCKQTRFALHFDFFAFFAIFTSPSGYDAASRGSTPSSGVRPYDNE